MTARAAPATAGKWLDTDVPLTPTVLAAVRAAGYEGVGRYVPLPRNSPAWDITARELAAILAAGLQCLLVQHVRGSKLAPLWDPGQHDGAEDARCAVAAARAAGYPDGAHLCLDLEAVSGTAFATTKFAVDWQAVVLDEGLLAGLYVGYSVPLHPLDLYDLPGFSTYWSDAGKRQVATRGCSIHQGPSIMIAGVEFDSDELGPDLLGGVPMVATAA